MKKYLFILLLIVSIGILAAAESNPSATVGYFKKSIASDSWETLSIPFNYASTSVDNILGTQFGPDDVIQDVYSGTNTTYIDGYGWFGDLTDLIPGGAYWVYRAPANDAMDYFIMGTVNPVPVTIHVYAAGWSCFSLNEAAPVPMENLNIAGAQPDDVIQDVLTGTNTTYIDGYGWFGDLLTIDPSQAYWYYTNAGSDFEWTYPAGRNGSTVTAPTQSKPHTPQMNKIKK
jgi:hypothetical protein